MNIYSIRLFGTRVGLIAESYKIAHFAVLCAALIIGFAFVASHEAGESIGKSAVIALSYVTFIALFLVMQISNARRIERPDSKDIPVASESFMAIVSISLLFANSLLFIFVFSRFLYVIFLGV